jgi:hypothetical protein
VPVLLPDAEQVVGAVDAGPLAGVATRGILHTTEGGSVASNIGVFQVSRQWPHLIVDPFAKRTAQALSLDRAARALPVHNAIAGVQIEIVAWAAQTPTWGDSELHYLWGVMREVERLTSIPRRSFIEFDATGQNRFRMSLEEFTTFRGWCGHQHAPSGGSHWDPGGIRIWDLITPRLAGTSSPGVSSRQLAVVPDRDAIMAVANRAGVGLVSARRERASGAWSAGAPVPGAQIAPTSPVAAVSRKPGLVDILFFDTGGHVRTTCWTESAGWSGQALEIGGGVVANPTGGLAAVARTPYNLDVFFCVGNGIVTSHWNEVEGWVGSFRVNRNVDAGAVAALVAVSDAPDSIDVFYVGADGRVYDLNWSNSWREPVDIGNGAIANAAGGIAAVACAPYHLDVFFADLSGAVVNAFWRRAEVGWQGAQRINAGTNAGPLPSVSALSRRPDVIDVWYVGADGHVHTTWWTHSDGWAPHVMRLTAGLFPPALDPMSGLASASPRPEELELAARLVGGNHATLRWRPGTGWTRSFEPVPL